MEHLQYDVRNKMVEHGINPDLFEVSVDITPVTTTDPEIILVNYKSVLPTSEYIRHAVKIEVSGRSMHAPVVEHDIRSMIDTAFPETPFAELRNLAYTASTLKFLNIKVFLQSDPSV